MASDSQRQERETCFKQEKVLRLWMEEKMFELDAKDLIPIVISILALTLTLFQYFGEYDRNRKQATLEAYDQLQGEVFLTLNKLRKQYPILSPDRNFEERPTITNCLAKLERFCVGINLRIFDLRTLERCGGAYFVRQYLYLKPIIQDKRTRKNGGSHYDEFEKVAMKLKKKYERRSETINWDEITLELLQEKTKSDE